MKLVFTLGSCWRENRSGIICMESQLLVFCAKIVGEAQRESKTNEMEEEKL